MHISDVFYGSLKHNRCFSHGLKMCMCFGYNPQIYFFLLFPHFECSHFFHICLQQKVTGIVIPAICPPKCIDSGYLVCATPTVLLTK